MRGVTPAAASRVGAPPPLMEGMTARAPLKFMAIVRESTLIPSRTRAPKKRLETCADPAVPGIMRTKYPGRPSQFSPGVPTDIPRTLY